MTKNMKQQGKRDSTNSKNTEKRTRQAKKVSKLGKSEPRQTNPDQRAPYPLQNDRAMANLGHTAPALGNKRSSNHKTIIRSDCTI